MKKNEKILELDWEERDAGALEIAVKTEGKLVLKRTFDKTYDRQY